eukprot:1177430-Prorocentrum_minimum.AAC.2
MTEFIVNLQTEGGDSPPERWIHLRVEVGEHVKERPRLRQRVGAVRVVVANQRRHRRPCELRLVLRKELVLMRIGTFTREGCQFMCEGCGFTRGGCGFTSEGCQFMCEGCAFTSEGFGFTSEGCGFTSEGCGFMSEGCRFMSKGCGFMKTLKP